MLPVIGTMILGNVTCDSCDISVQEGEAGCPEVPAADREWRGRSGRRTDHRCPLTVTSCLLRTSLHQLTHHGQHVGLAQSGGQVAPSHLGQAAAQELVGRGQGGQGGPRAGEGEAGLGQIPAGHHM